MPPFRPYSITPGQTLVVDVHHDYGSRARVTGVLDRVPEIQGGEARRIVLRAQKVEALPVTSS
jgi:hypothetical protein